MNKNDNVVFTYLLNSGTAGLQTEDDIVPWFTVSEIDCPITSYSLRSNDSPTLSQYAGTDVYLQTVSQSKVLKISTSTLRQSQILVVKARTDSEIERLKHINVTVCQKPYPSSSYFEYHYNRSLGKQDVISVSSLFTHVNVCPDQQYTLLTRDSFGNY